MTEVLDGIKIVDFTLAAAGPTCTKLLAEYGAECWLVEPVTGVPNRPNIQFTYMNSNKKSIPINLKTEKGKKVMQDLLENADVFVTNYRTKALVKLGLDYETLHTLFPGLIYANITGYGDNGPMKDEAGFDTTAFWGMAGLMNDMQEKDGPPIVPPSGVGDIITGAVLALGVCAALNYRSKHQKGIRVDTSLLATGLYANYSQMMLNQYGVSYPKSRMVPNRALMNTYPCKDGYFMLTTINWEKDFWNLLRVIGREDLVGDPRWTCMKDTENANAPELREILDEAFSKMTLAEAKEKLLSVDMAFGEIKGSKEAMSNPQVLENGYTVSFVNADGKMVVAPCSPLRFNNEPTSFVPGPELGRDTRRILSKIGYTEDTIQELIDEKVVAAC